MNKFLKGIIVGGVVAVLVVAIATGIKFISQKSSSADLEQNLYDAFLSGDIGAVGNYEDGEEYTIYASDLEIGGDDWDSYEVYGYLDADNDGKDELILQGPYGIYILDANKKQVNIFAYGGGTANNLLLANYDDAYWLVYAYRDADMSQYSMFKYNGADGLVDAFYYGCQMDENGNPSYFRVDKDQTETPISEEEFGALQDAILPLYRDETDNIDALYGDNMSPISEADVEAFQVTCEANEALGFENFDDYEDIMQASYEGTWYDPEGNQAIRIYEDGCYYYFPALELYGDQLYEWELVDRSDRGLCPMLEIYVDGRDIPGFAFYICGKRDNYFWCNSQCEIFYKQ